MKRIVVLTVLIAAGAVSYVVAQQGGQKPMVVEVEKLKDNLFVLKGDGGGGNTTVFVQSNGITVVDTKNPGWGAPILEKIKELSPKPVTTIINTHTHGDHVSGNVEFPATVDIVVQENTATNMKAMKPVTGLSKPGAPAPPNIFEQNGGKGPAEAHVQGPHDAVQGARSDRALLCGPWTHERRRMGAVPGAARGVGR